VAHAAEGSRLVYQQSTAEFSFSLTNEEDQDIPYLLTLDYDYEVWPDYFEGPQAYLYGWHIVSPSYINGTKLTAREVELLPSQLSKQTFDMIDDFVDSLIP
jgi:hypothetical protein